MKTPVPSLRARFRNLAAGAAVATATLAGTSAVQAEVIRIVVDNDYALFAGNSSGVSRLLYQNNFTWGSPGGGNGLTTQVGFANAGGFDFGSLLAGEDFLYIVALGGGGKENLSGTINGINITSASNVEQSSAIANGSLTAYSSGAVVSGTYNVLLSDVAAAFGSLSWTPPTQDNDEIVPSYNVAAGGNASGSTPGTAFGFGDSTTVLFKFSATDFGLNLSAIPEPASALALGGLLGLGFVSRNRRRR